MREEAEEKVRGNIRNWRGRGKGWIKRLQRKRNDARWVGGVGGKEIEDERMINKYERERERRNERERECEERRVEECG